MMELGLLFPKGTSDRDADAVKRIVTGIDKMTGGKHERAIRLLSMAVGCLCADFGRVHGHVKSQDTMMRAIAEDERIMTAWVNHVAAELEAAAEARRQALISQIGVVHEKEGAA